MHLEYERDRKTSRTEQIKAIVTGYHNSNVSLFSTDICQSVESALFSFAMGITIIVFNQPFFFLTENNTSTRSHLEAASFTHSLICWPVARASFHFPKLDLSGD